jgi:hypothetical protein
MCSSSWHVQGQQNCQADWVPVTPTIVALCSVSGATGLVTIECSAPKYTMKIIGWTSTFILTMGSLGPSSKEPGLP